MFRLRLSLLFIALAIASGLSTAQISWHLASGALILIVGFGLFAGGWIGGGDAKLAAATAIWLGFDHLGEYASLLGGMLTLLILGLRYWPVLDILTNQDWIRRLHETHTGIPYGITLAIAGLLLLLYPESAVWLAATAAR